MKKILLTGPNNPLGQEILIQIFEYFPEANIVTLSRGDSVHNYQNKVKHFSVDLESDIPFFDNIDLLIHTASCVPSIAKSNDQYINVNYEGSSRLIKNINFTRNAKILNISSSSVYSDPKADTLFENSLKASDDKYGLSKLMFENFLQKHFENSSVKFLNCRIPVLLVKNVQNNFISKWKKEIQNGNPITIFNRNSKLNACFLGSDIFLFFLDFIKNYNQNLSCNLSCSEPIKIVDAAKLVMNQLGEKVDIIEKKTDQKAQLLSNQLAVSFGLKVRTVEDALIKYLKGG